MQAGNGRQARAGKHVMARRLKGIQASSYGQAGPNRQTLKGSQQEQKAGKGRQTGRQACKVREEGKGRLAREGKQ
jgi:hypothetical protein